jgi:hypothetical protein
MIRILAVLFIISLFSLTWSACLYPEWYNGLVVENGDLVVSNGFVFKAQNSPSTFDTPPSTAISNWYWEYVAECTFDYTDDTVSTEQGVQMILAGFSLAFAVGVTGYGINVIITLLRRIG